jgi:hypothetical protein
MIFGKGKEFKPRRKPRHFESALQKGVVKYLSYQYPGLLFFAVPNGGARNKTEAGILKGEGVLAGVSDLLLFWQGGMGAIELKFGKNDESDRQKEFALKWKLTGGLHAVCRSIDEVAETLKSWNIPKHFQCPTAYCAPMESHTVRPKRTGRRREA